MKFALPEIRGNGFAARAWLLLGVMAFALAYTQAPLYYSNQNQYFLHGLAQGGMGLLHEDWLAGTADPTPLFSAFVAATYRWLGESWFYFCYAAIQGIYFISLAWLGLGISSQKSPPPPLPQRGEGESDSAPPTQESPSPLTPIPQGVRGENCLPSSEVGGRADGAVSFLPLPAGEEGEGAATTLPLPAGGEGRGEGENARRGPACLLFAVLFVLVHSGLLRLASTRLLGIDYPWYLQAGLAGQYILGPVLQPSTFGVLLPASIALFLSNRPIAAVVVATMAATLHSTYLLSAGVITTAYLYVLIRASQVRTAAIAAVLFLLLVAPVIAYNLATFGPTSAEEFARAQEILVHFRIPHHCEIARWFDHVAAMQVLWIVLAGFLVRRSRLFPIIAVSAGIGATLTLIQLATGNDTLALLFPWRVSAYLVPMATAVIVGKLTQRAARYLAGIAGRPRLILQGSLAVVLLALASAGLAISLNRWAYQLSSDEWPMLEHVRRTRAAGQVYLVPVDLPKPPARPGSFSSDFKPLSQRQHGRGLIPIELQGFRLSTGVPILVDFKSIPYRDVDVLEWFERLHLVRRLYGSDEADRRTALRELLQRFRITHVVVPAGHPLVCPGATLEFEDEPYRVYRLRGGQM